MALVRVTHDRNESGIPLGSLSERLDVSQNEVF